MKSIYLSNAPLKKKTMRTCYEQQIDWEHSAKLPHANAMLDRGHALKIRKA